MDTMQHGKRNAFAFIATLINVRTVREVVSVHSSCDLVVEESLCKSTNGRAHMHVFEG